MQISIIAIGSIFSIWSLLFTKQQTAIAEIKTDRTYNIELYVVMDHTLYMLFNKDTDALMARSRDIVNQVDTIFRRHHLRVHLVGVEIWSKGDRIDFKGDSSSVLQQFNKYAMENTRFDGADHVHLITGYHPFDDDVVRLAYVAQMCSLHHSTGFSTDSVHRHIRLTGLIMAHELGHSLGMRHDRGGCSCVDNTGCIMSPSVIYPIARYFSACSIQDLQSRMDSFKSYCIINKPTVLLNISKRCGNNIVDKGEECDCGDPYFCKNPCCNPWTCRYTREGSQCFEGGCCTKDCKLKAADTVCRNTKDADSESDSSCDLPDLCDGQSAICANTYKEDLSMCDDAQGACRKGNCKSHRLQCKLMWGGEATTIVAHLQCFQELNQRGNASGNCGPTLVGYKACHTNDTFCGKLYCQNMGDFRFPTVGWSRGYKVIRLQVDTVEHQCVLANIDSGRSQPDQSIKQNFLTNFLQLVVKSMLFQHNLLISM